jgi:glycosyltransferase involved in cell wall biosynthesis
MSGAAPGEGINLLHQADRHRDRGDWAAAAAAYAAWLDRNPADWPIWVQHGHCVKEAGDPEGALASYRRAEAGQPRDADVKLQIGHALKRLGDLGGARAAYAAALDLDPGSEVAWQELSVLLGRPGLPPEPEEAAGLSLAGGLRVVFDISDLLAWFDGARAPTGIQRVQMEVALPALRAGAPAAGVRLAVFRPESGSWRALPREIFRRLLLLCRAGADAGDPGWREAVVRAREALEAAPDLAFAEGEWLVNLGSSWWLPDYHRALRAARRASGLRYAALVHDCGPVVMPEHSPPETSARYARWLSVLTVEADLLLAVSQATARDLAAVQAAHLPGLPCAPVALLTLDAVPSPPPPARPHAGVAALAGTPYILFVATVESRKDHLFVLNAWLNLLRRRGAAVPRLVLVGREGFGGGPALALLARAPAFEGRVLRFDDIPDGTLAELRRGALFTVYNSAHEGWGLPVTEALSAGKVVVAPAHSGLLESGAGLALPFTPGSEPEFLALVERLLDDAGFRAAQEARIARELRLRSWQEVADGLLAVLDRTPASAAPPPALAPATLLRLASIERPLPAPEMFWADRLREGEGWHAPEGWGCWTRPGRALLRLPLDAAPGTPLRLHLGLRGAGVVQRVAIRLDGGDAVALEVGAGAEPIAAIGFEAGGEAVEIAIEAPAALLEDGRAVGIGVVALMACRADDVPARLGFLERLRFTWPELA